MVDAAPREGSAPGNAPGCERCPADRTVPPDRLLGVLGAGGGEAALASQPARERHLIEANQADQQEPDRRPERPEGVAKPARHRITCARVSNPSTSDASSCVRAPAIVALATRTTSFPSTTLGASSRHAARRMRRARLRRTAPPTRRPATNAADPVPGATNSTTRSAWNALPSLSTRSTFVWSARLGRQTGPALCATPREDRSTGPCPHADAEPVPLVAAAIVRLEGSLGHDLGRVGVRSASIPKRRRRPSRAALGRESVTRARVGRAVGKTPVLSSRALPSGDAVPPRAEPRLPQRFHNCGKALWISSGRRIVRGSSRADMGARRRARPG